MATGILSIARLVISDTASRIIRFLAWNYRMFSVDAGKGISVAYPLHVEGPGTLTIGQDSQIKSKVRIGIMKEARVALHQQVTLHPRADLHAGAGSTITLENNTSILANSILRNGKKATLKTGSSIASGCQVFPREDGFDGEFFLGKGSNIGDHSLIDTCDDVIIKDFVALGPYCILYTHDHDYKSSSIAAWKGSVKTGPIILEKGCWIGARVTILPGVTVGEKAVVAAGSLLTKNVKPGDVVGGIPARSLKKETHEKQA